MSGKHIRAAVHLRNFEKHLFETPPPQHGQSLLKVKTIGVPKEHRLWGADWHNAHSYIEPQHLKAK
ncbi:MAG TPA: hypothetical protein PKG71_00245 [Candidatus Woesebacteria bacterium]|jgi:NADPH-dependent curcumin reductase CurA|nr:hypothetical protein [Candidatus Woesebacteria bacterium]HNS94387.1 hypothetical protein [Candidatus Woesebacteria bacterium]